MVNEAFKMVLCQTIFGRSCPLLTLYYYLYIIGGFFMTIILYIMAKIVSKMMSY